jgi:hypothetical protein
VRAPSFLVARQTPARHGLYGEAERAWPLTRERQRRGERTAGCKKGEPPAPAIERIGSLVAPEHPALIDDAPGAHAEMQSLLAGYNLRARWRLSCRSRIPQQSRRLAAYHIPPPEGAQGFAVHAAKDREMARRADYGLMVWNGISPGTALNVLRPTLIGSPCVVYDTMRGTVMTTYNIADWQAMLQSVGAAVHRQIEARMTADERLGLAE